MTESENPNHYGEICPGGGHAVLTKKIVWSTDSSGKKGLKSPNAKAITGIVDFVM
jgi:hypothetical protein